MLRAVLFRRADDEQVLLLVAHHIVIDFWSLAILMRELGEHYRMAANGAMVTLAATLVPHTSNYFDYVRWQQQLLAGDAGERLAAFWQKQLAGELPVLNLHTDRPRPAVQTFRGASEPLRLDAQLTSRLKALSQANDATLFTTLLTAFKVLLYRYTGQEDLLVGSPTAGRHSAQFAATVGYFVNPVVLRTSPNGALSFEEFLKQVRHTTLAALAHQEYPFALLVKQLQPERDPSRSPLFQVMFNLNKAQLEGEEAMGAFSLGEAGARMNLGGLPLESMRLEQRIAQFDLSLTMVEVGNELSASLEYNTDLFDAATIKRLLGHFQTLLEAVAARPSQRLDRLPLLNESERHLLLDEWSGAVEDRATGKGLEHAATPLVHQLFEQNVEQHPENTAVVFEGARLSYGELNARANRLAHYLRRRGVSMDVPVAICVERSLEMVVALMGVLKAGGAYVPLDPRYPRERLAFMLAETCAPWLLTQRHLVEGLPASSAQALCLDEDWDEIALESEDNPKVTQAARESCLCHLHLRLDRTSEGRDGFASEFGRRLSFMAEALPARLLAVRPANGKLLLRCFHGGYIAGVNLRRTTGSVLAGHYALAARFIRTDARGEGRACRVRARTHAGRSCSMSKRLVKRWTSCVCSSPALTLSTLKSIKSFADSAAMMRAYSTPTDSPKPPSTISSLRAPLRMDT